MSIDTVLFDLDGTLIDSAPLVGGILNRMRENRGWATLPSSCYRQWISLGATALVGRAMEADARDTPSLVEEFRRRYHVLPTPMDTLFPGVAETLAILTASGVQLGLCSNKPEHLCRKVLSDTELILYFGSVVGGDTTSQPKPHRQPIDCALETLGSAPEFTILVGDSTVDQRAAGAANVPFVFFSQGYDDGVNAGAAHWCVDALPEVLDIVRNS